MYEQVFDPVSDSLGLSTIFASLPLLTLFVLLGVFRVTAWVAGLAALAVALPSRYSSGTCPSGSRSTWVSRERPSASFRSCGS